MNQSIKPNVAPAPDHVEHVAEASRVLLLFVDVQPQVIWLGMAPMFLGAMELVVHGQSGVSQRRRLGYSVYNPGLATAFAFAAVAISYVVVVVSGGLMSGWGWLWAFLYFVGSVLLCVLLPENLLKSKTTRWAFGEDELLGFYERYADARQVLAGSDTRTA